MRGKGTIMTMPGVLDIAGPILEVLTWICLPAGLILLVAVGTMRRFEDQWTHSEGVVYSDESGVGFRWYDHHYQVHNAPMSPHDIRHMAPGDAVTIHYAVKTPTRWRTSAPEVRAEAAGVLGWILSGIGAAALVIGFLLPMF